MATCAKCQSVYPDGAGTCAGCGQPLPVAPAPRTVCLTPAKGPAARAEPPLPAPETAAVVVADEPAPQVEVTPDRTPVPSQLAATGGPGGRAPATLADMPRPVGTVVADDEPDPFRPPSTACAAAPPGSITPPPVGPAVPAVPAVPQLRPRLVVIRGMRMNAEYQVYAGRNTIGRFADRPVDIDLVSQEAEGQVWSSRLHAAVVFDTTALFLEDLNSLNGTWLNGARVHPGHLRPLKTGDVIQIGTVQLKLVID